MTFLKISIKNVQELFQGWSTVPNAAALLFFLLIFIGSRQYGFFGDELYYFACSKHLDFGYVDHPPLVALLTLISTWIFGETMTGLRFLSGLAGAIIVLLSAQLARLLGGGKFSQALVALSICFAPAFLALSSFFSMNPVDIMLCTLFIVLFLKTIETPSPKKWISMGVVLGLGLLNKYTFLVLGFSLLVSLLVTKQRTLLKSRWIYISGIIGLLMFMPHILWQIHYNWPTLEFMRNATEHKNLSLSPIAFFLQIFIGLNPFTFPLWLSGVLYLLFGKEMKKYRFLGWTAIVFLVVYFAQNSKFYYVVPIFPLLLSSGAVVIEKFSQKHLIRWPKYAVVSTMIVSGVLFMPLATPLLPVGQFVRYSKTLGLWNLIRMEKGEGDTLPLHFVYRFGWEELVDSIGKVYNTLPQEDREKCAILASWYGPAGAVDHFGPKYGLPNAICGRNSYWMWGTRNYSGEVVLAVGFDECNLRNFFKSVEQAGYFKNHYAYDAAIYLCKKPKSSLREMWPHCKSFM
jgi:Dolichyl-phosphate-mannose-protein mannosyltransferase